MKKTMLLGVLACLVAGSMGFAEQPGGENREVDPEASITEDSNECGPITCGRRRSVRETRVDSEGVSYVVYDETMTCAGKVFPSGSELSPLGNLTCRDYEWRTCAQTYEVIEHPLSGTAGRPGGTCL